MKRVLAVLFFCCLAVLSTQADVRIQTNWHGGPLQPGPVTEFGDTFASSESINFYYWSGLWLAYQPNLTPSPRNVGSQTNAYYAKAGDINSNGLYDVFASSSTNNPFVWFENLGDGNFGPPNTIMSTHAAYVAFNIVDLDMDGHADLIVGIDSGSPHRFSWFHNDGQGNFTEKVIDPNFSQVDIGVAIDFTQNGRLDIFAGAYQSSALKWYENLGWNDVTNDFDWNIHVLVPSGHYGAENIGMTTGDFNGDGWIDVAFACRGNGQIVWWEYVPGWTDPTQAFVEHVIATGVTEAYSCVAIDFNWNGHLDLVTSSRNGRIDWWENDGAGNFTHHSIATGYSGCREVMPIDVDFDGNFDIVSASQTGNTLDWWENDGEMNFTRRTWATGYGGAHGVVAGLFDNRRMPMALTTANSHHSVDWWDIIAGFRESGTLISSVLDTELDDPEWSTFMMNTHKPTGTEIEFYVRGGHSYDECVNATWQGPYTSNFYIGDAIGHGLRYFQYRVDMSTSNPDVSPRVNEVLIYFYEPASADGLALETATREEGVLISWNTTLPVHSYDILRTNVENASIDSAYVKLNDRPLPGNSRSAYLDMAVEPGAYYSYKVRLTDDNGAVSLHGPVVGRAPGDLTRERPQLYQSHPNPTDYMARIEFELPGNALVSLEIYDVAGRLVQRVYDSQPLTAGRHTTTINTAPFENGVYLYRLSVDGDVLVRRLVVNR